MSSIAEKVKDLAGKRKAIVYCSWAKECDQLSLALSQLDVKSASYTGKDTTRKDKMQIQKNINDGSIDILVATKAFGVGIDLPDIDCVFHIGVPETLSLFTQEIGRAGRQGQQAFAYLIINEPTDLKKFGFWTKDASPEEKENRYEDICQVLKFISTAFTGECLRKFQSKYFQDEEPSNEIALAHDLCCSGCVIKANIPFVDVSADVFAIFSCIQTLHQKGMAVV